MCGASGPSIWASSASASTSASWLTGDSFASRASARFSKSLMRSNSRITLRTALCISRLSMSSVVRLTAFSHHWDSFSRRCSLVSLSGSPAASPSPVASMPSAGPACSVRCVYSHTCVRKRLQRSTAESLQLSVFCGRAAYSTARRTVSAP